MQTQETVAGYEISTDARRLNLDVIHAFLAQESYWSQGVPRSVVERAIANSLCFGVYHGDVQVGFARVVTDRSTFALLADVFVLKGHRGKGLSKWLVRCVVEHEDLQGLRRFLLATSDAHGCIANSDSTRSAIHRASWKSFARISIARVDGLSGCLHLCDRDRLCSFAQLA